MNDTQFDCCGREHALGKAILGIAKETLSRPMPKRKLSDPMDDYTHRKIEAHFCVMQGQFIYLFNLVWELHERLKALEKPVALLNLKEKQRE